MYAYHMCVLVCVCSLCSLEQDTPTAAQPSLGGQKCPPRPQQATDTVISEGRGEGGPGGGGHTGLRLCCVGVCVVMFSKHRGLC